jgi:hypothetical protein
MRVYGYAVFVGMWAVVSLFALGQASEQLIESSGPSSVPRLVKFRGTLADSAGHPRSGTVGILFAIYSDPSGGVYIWQELQNVKLDEKGHYSVLLGRETRDGIPLEVFSSGESRWLGVRPLGEEEQPRVLLTSVPYALKAADADTLGGFPASAFVRANSGTVVQNVAPSSQQPASAEVLAVASSLPSFASSPQLPTPGHGTVSTIPKFSTPTSIGDSQIKDSAGVVTLQNLEHFVFADRFRGGDIGAQINAAITLWERMVELSLSLRAYTRQCAQLYTCAHPISQSWELDQMPLRSVI